jgi:hypothetical protein
MKVYEWRQANPEPVSGSRRARKRWGRKLREFIYATETESWRAQLEAEEKFKNAQFAIAKFRPASLDDIALMAAAAAIYDKTHLASGQRALISYGTALGLFAVLPHKPAQAV